MSAPLQVSEAFMALVDLAVESGARSIGELPGCWEHQIDEQWWVAINGGREPRKCSRGVVVEPISGYVEFNGWPAGVLEPSSVVIAAGELANEDTLIAAVTAARMAMRQTP